MESLGHAHAVPDEERPVTRGERYEELVARLSRQSVVKHFDAYADVDWDAPESRIDPDDPRWALSDDDPLGATAWYRAQPPAVQARIGLHVVANFMKIGVQFESVLKRGLLDFACDLPNGAPEFRYVYHEVIEEAQHSLMFQEFVNRAGFPTAGLGWWDRQLAHVVVRLARLFPELFFVFVLGGEDPIDHVQRRVLQRKQNVPPLLKRIMQIHVTEEARHLCFARQFLRRRVPELGPIGRLVLGVGAPIILSMMAQRMMQPSPAIIRAHGVPRSVVDEAYRRNPLHRERTLDAIAKVRTLCQELGIVTPLAETLWRALGIWRRAAAPA